MRKKVTGRRRAFNAVSAVLIVLVCLPLLAAGTLIGCFYISGDSPENAFVGGTAIVVATPKNSDTSELWLVRRVDEAELGVGENTAFYVDGKFVRAFYYRSEDSVITVYTDPDDLSTRVDFDSENMLGEIKAVWSK